MTLTAPAAIVNKACMFSVKIIDTHHSIEGNTQVFCPADTRKTLRSSTDSSSLTNDNRLDERLGERLHRLRQKVDVHSSILGRAYHNALCLNTEWASFGNNNQPQSDTSREKDHTGRI